MLTPISSQAERYLKEFVRSQAGIQLDSSKAYLLQSRLAPLVGRHALSGFDELAAEVKRAPHSRLALEVIDAMTTNETLFFRDVRPWEALRHSILPTLIRQNAAHKRLSVWCAAASSGQEPYSLAMLVRTHFPELLNWDLKFLATDISDSMLARCSEGLYSAVEVGRGLDPGLLDRFFRSEAGGYRIDPALRRMFEFRKLNLTQSFGGIGPFDLILMRNVLIYFDEAVKLDILRRARSSLRLGGVLMLGATEMVSDKDWERCSEGDCRYLRRAA